MIVNIQDVNYKDVIQDTFEKREWIVSQSDYDADLIVAKNPHNYKPTVIVGRLKGDFPVNVIDVIRSKPHPITLELRIRLYEAYLQSNNFEAYLKEEFLKSRRYTLPLSLVIIRIYENDPLLIKEFYYAFSTVSRSTDKAFRISEGEFAVVLPGTGREGAEIFIRRFSKKITKEYIKERVLKKPDFIYGIGTLEDWMKSEEDLISSSEYDLLSKLR
ncbi:MAG: hypothetical protein J7L34_06680 [Thermotogaceae bacterium]|nr:hypothetical protein [Thermotogaceae bacterium]